MLRILGRIVERSYMKHVIFRFISSHVYSIGSGSSVVCILLSDLAYSPWERRRARG